MEERLLLEWEDLELLRFSVKSSSSVIGPKLTETRLDDIGEASASFFRFAFLIDISHGTNWRQVTRGGGSRCIHTQDLRMYLSFVELYS